jgi:2-oxo-4-hydroxy-4-carboxy-5-ureidoimidazoline decarboxylase
MTEVLVRWNLLPPARAAEEILSCCGSSAGAEATVARRPLASEAAVLAAAGEIWRSLSEADWLQAFRSHPRIGESRGATDLQAGPAASGRSLAWSEQEQRRVSLASEAAKLALAEGNRVYERRFHRIFIVCATGKAPEEILEILERRLRNDAASELREAVEQQWKITEIRLRRWLQG